MPYKSVLPQIKSKILQEEEISLEEFEVLLSKCTQNARTQSANAHFCVQYLTEWNLWLNFFRGQTFPGGCHPHDVHEGNVNSCPYELTHIKGAPTGYLKMTRDVLVYLPPKLLSAERAELGTLSMTTTEPERCTICQETVTEPSTVFPCFHRLDFSCLKRWIHVDGDGVELAKCPTCRESILGILYERPDYYMNVPETERVLEIMRTQYQGPQEIVICRDIMQKLFLGALVTHIPPTPADFDRVTGQHSILSLYHYKSDMESHFEAMERLEGMIRTSIKDRAFRQEITQMAEEQLPCEDISDLQPRDYNPHEREITLQNMQKIRDRISLRLENDRCFKFKGSLEEDAWKRQAAILDIKEARYSSFLFAQAFEVRGIHESNISQWLERSSTSTSTESPRPSSTNNQQSDGHANRANLSSSDRSSLSSAFSSSMIRRGLFDNAPDVRKRLFHFPNIKSLWRPVGTLLALGLRCNAHTGLLATFPGLDRFLSIQCCWGSLVAYHSHPLPDVTAYEEAARRGNDLPSISTL